MEEHSSVAPFVSKVPHMRRFVLLFLALIALLPVTAQAQRPAFSKLSPLVREACLSAQLSTAHRSRAAQPMPSRTLYAFVRLATDDATSLRDQECRILLQKGDLAIAAIPVDRIAALSLDSEVLRIEAGQRATATMDTTATLVHATAAWEGLRLPQQYTGRGVVVGVQDIGFDLTHPTFWSPDMQTYRIGALWDQLATDTLGAMLPVGRDYVGRDALLKAQHPRDGLTQTHGTHTTGITAGSGAEGDGTVSPYRGIAWESDIALVCNATSDDAALIDPKDYYKYTFALDALGFKYLFDYADRLGEPCVINFSEGSQEDFHGYDQLYYAMLDSLCGPGHIIVSSAGNGGGGINYVHKLAGTQQAGVFLGSNGSTAMVTTKATANHGVTFSFYGTEKMERTYSLSAVTTMKDSLLTDTFLIDTCHYALTAQTYTNSYNARETVCDWMLTRLYGDDLSTPYPVAVAITVADADVELFPGTGYLYHSDTDPTMADGDNSHSINSPASAPAVICVGATAYRPGFTNYLGQWMSYDFGTDGRRASYSAVGPTWDGRVKPDVMAPGQNIVSAYSSFYEEHNPTARDITSDVRHFQYGGRTYAWNSNGGTSMASPVVAGAIALWLQANPRLTADDCRKVFAKTCHRYDASLAYPNNRYGYGEIDVAAGLEEVLRMAADGIEDISVYPQSPSLNPRPSVLNQQPIYTLDGRFVGTDTHHLAPGFYIRGGRKLVIR